jgi:O-6-methylguanine DNA methyltransferase
MLALSRIHTKVGSMLAGASEQGICLFDFEYRRSISSVRARVEHYMQEQFTDSDHFFFAVLRQQVEEYFSGIRKTFDVPLVLAGSDFQKRVWHALLQIPYGETRTYKQQSVALGDEKAVRAVATANGENGLAILVPCHRVIAENGSLTGYSGGLEKKKWLLDHERVHSGKTSQLNLFT